MIENYVAKTVDCECGKKHKSNVEKVIINENAVTKYLKEFLLENGYDTLTLICDENGYAVSGDKVKAVLDELKLTYKIHKFTDKSLVPDERSVGNILMGALKGSKIFLAVGSGTINDLTRYTSAILGLPFATVGTAPSMDGYISGGSALIYNGTKITYETHAPQAVFFEPKTLANAPRDMIAAGVGDLLGKIGCLKDWKLSKLINDEYLCDFIHDTTAMAIDQVLDAKDGIVAQEDEAVATLLESLLMSGVCMDYTGNSRPASGCEHHMSHFWEMRYIMENRPAVFHGAKVGIGTVISLKAYDYVSNLNPDFAKIKNTERKSFAVWEEEVKKAFKSASNEIIELEKAKGKNNLNKINARLDVIENKWNEIKALANSVKKPEVVIDFLQKLDAPIYPKDIGVDREMARQAITYAKEIRDRYTVLQLLYDLNELENFVSIVINEYYGK